MRIWNQIKIEREFTRKEQRHMIRALRKGLQRPDILLNIFVILHAKKSLWINNSRDIRQRGWSKKIYGYWYQICFKYQLTFLLPTICLKICKNIKFLFWTSESKRNFWKFAEDLTMTCHVNWPGILIDWRH